MRKALFFVVLTALAALEPALAANISFTTSAAHDLRLERLRTERNAAICVRYGFAPGCNQTQVCNAAGFPGCDATIARDNRIHLPADIQATIVTLAWEQVLDIERKEQDEDVSASCSAWRSANATARSNACTALGRPTTCRLCP